jgi:hypothetical protein
MFHNIRQGPSLSMLILMSMMVAAATIFPSPVKDFGFKKHITDEVQTIRSATTRHFNKCK